MASEEIEPPTGRETRLLVLVVAVAVVVLLLLAQFRFRGGGLSMVSPNAAPFAGLAARATFDELASTMADVINRVSPLTVAVPIVARAAVGERVTAEPGAAPETPAPPRLMLALRVRRDLALLHIPDGFVPQDQPDAAIDVVARDEAREMTLIRVAPSSVAPDTLSASVRTFPGFVYAAAVDATPVGPTVQPVFFGRGDTVADPRWSHALVPASVGPGLTVGTWVFSLDSRLIGVVVRGDGGAMVVPAPALETLVQALEAEEGASQ